MHAVLARERLVGKAERFPFRVNLAPKGRGGRRRRVRRAEEIAAELAPLKVLGVPLHDVVVDGRSGRDEGGAHGHEETVEDEDAVAELGAVEAPAELLHVARRLGRLPLGVEAVGVDAELGARVDGVVHETVRERLFPGNAELGLELCLGHRELFGFQQRRLGRDGVVVLIDELVLVDLRRGDVALGEDLDPLGGELGDDEVLHRSGVGVGLDEHEGRVHERRLGVGG